MKEISNTITKTGDLATDVRSGYYRQERDRAYHDRTIPITFYDDLKTWLLSEGVPEKYVSKVAYHAWQQGHDCGEHEVFGLAQDLVEIFL